MFAEVEAIDDVDGDSNERESEKLSNFFVNFSSCDPLLNKDEKFSYATLNAKTLRRAGLKSLYLGAVAMNLTA